MPRHRHIETVARYFNGCNAGDREMMLSCFARDIEVYTIGYPPRFGRQAVAQLFVDLHSAGARYTIDHCVVQEPEAVVEWSSLWTPPGQAKEMLVRGIDWFVFQSDGRIKGIREFVQQDAGSTGSPLDQFPYAGRGYPTEADLDSRLPN